MKKFRFPLDIVLEYRRQVQDSLQVELGAAAAEVRRQEQVLENARRRYADINREYRERRRWACPSLRCGAMKRG